MTASGRMHAAKIATSPRLQRVHALLSDGDWHSTYEVIAGARVAAVNSIISELRENGFYIEGRWDRDERTGQRIYLYRMPFAGLAAE